MKTASPKKTLPIPHIAKGIAIAAIVIFVLAVVMSIANRNQGVTMMSDTGSGGFSRNTVTPLQSPMTYGSDVASTDMMKSSEAVSAPAVGMMTAAPEDNALVTEKKVIKTGDLSLQVESVEKTMEHLRWVASQFGGDIFSSSVYDVSGNGVSKSGQATLKVPVAHFDEAMQSAKSIARVVASETTSGQDVTSDYIDLQARLKNKQAEEESIAAILDRDTNKIDDVLQVTMQLARVRGEIEQLQAQVKYLDNQTDMSTINVSFSEDAQVGKADTTWRPSQEVKNAVNALIVAGQRMISFLISFIIAVLPILIILLLIFGGILYVVVKKLYSWLNR